MTHPAPAWPGSGPQRPVVQQMDEDRIAKIKEEIKALQESWPAHGVSPALMAELDDLEAELERLQQAPAEQNDAPDENSH